MISDVRSLLLDANVLIYSLVEEYALHQQALLRLSQLEHAGIEFWVSPQVIREFVSVLTRQSLYTVRFHG